MRLSIRVEAIEEITDAEGQEDTGKVKPGRLAEAIEETEEISDVEEDTGRESVVAVCGGEQRVVRGGIGEACVVLEVARQVLNLLALLVLKYRY